jgi:hypothetical protein
MPPESSVALAPWLAEGLFWVAVAILVALLSGVVAAWMLQARVRRLERRLSNLGRLEALETAIGRLVASQSDLDLRRLEHVLIDIRDGQRRVEDRLLAVVEASRPLDAGTSSVGRPLALPATAGGASALADRVVTRLLALGYERVQLVTPIAELADLVTGDGEVRIEARRDGAPCKGRIVVRAGTIADVQIQAAYSTFP